MTDAGAGPLGDRIQDLLPRPAADIVRFVHLSPNATSGLAGIVLLALWLLLANTFLLLGYRFAFVRS